MNSLAIDVRARGPLAVQVLQQVLLPISSTRGAGAHSPAITFGSAADEILAARHTSDTGRLEILRIYVHSPTFETIAIEMNLALGWSVRESELLWGKIVLPVV